MCVDVVRVGVAIATHNSGAVIGDCLAGLAGAGFVVVLCDDASSDDTVAIAREVIPEIDVVCGDGTLWWAGGTRRAVERCLELGCEYVVLLNPDVVLSGSSVWRLVQIAQAFPGAIVAPVVVDRDNPEVVAWAGSRFARLRFLPVFTSRYVYRRGCHVSTLPEDAWDVDEAHGRGVVLSRSVIDRLGMLDVEKFPHYGADNDYSFRARAAGFRILVTPEVRASLVVRNSGMWVARDASVGERLRHVGRYLVSRKHGEAARVWWHLLRRHVPAYAVFPSYLFNVSLGVARRLR